MKIKSLETFCRGTQLGVVRVRTDDGAEGWGQLSTFNADITATVLHRQLAPCALGADASDIDIAVFLGKTQFAGKIVPHDISVQQRYRPLTQLQKTCVENVGDGRFAGPRKARQKQS